MTTMKRNDKDKDGRAATGIGENFKTSACLCDIHTHSLTQTLRTSVISFTSFEKF